MDLCKFHYPELWILSDRGANREETRKIKRKKAQIRKQAIKGR